MSSSATACPFPDGVLHDHGAHQCHEASYRAGAVDALRAAARSLLSATCTCESCDTYLDAARVVDLRADRIARGESGVTS